MRLPTRLAARKLARLEERKAKRAAGELESRPITFAYNVIVRPPPREEQES